MKKQLLILTTLFITVVANSQTFIDNFITYEVTSATTVRTIDYNTAGGTNVTIPATVANASTTYNVTNIGPNSFSGKQLSSVIIPASVTEIRSGAFQNNNLTTVTIPENMFNIQSWCFMGNPLTTIVSLNTTPPFLPPAGGGDAFDNRGNINLTIPFGTTGPYVTNVGAQWTGFNSVSDILTFVVDYITYQVTSATTVRTIGYNTAGGTNLIIPATVSYGSITYNVTNVGPNSFFDKQLSSVIIPASVTEIRSGAFQNNNLTTITFPENMVNIQSWSFMGNPLTTIVSLNTTPPSIPNAGGGDAFDNRGNINLTIPSGTMGPYVTNVGAKWTGFNSVSIALMLNDIFISDDATYLVTSDNTIRITDYNTVGGTSVNIPPTVTVNGIVYSVTEIGNSAFFDKNLTSVTIPNTVKNIGISAFNNNNLTSIIIPDSVTDIGSQAFVSNNINSLVLGNSVENIGLGAFVDNNLTSIIIPSSVTNIGAVAFAANPLSSITSLATTPPAITTGTNDTFNISGNRSGINLIIPTGTTSAYATNSGALWTGFNSVTESGSLSTSNFELANNIKVITNKDVIRITHSNSVQLKNYTIFTISGAQIKKGKESSIYIDTLSRGIYILQIEFNEGKATKKFVK